MPNLRISTIKLFPALLLLFFFIPNATLAQYEIELEFSLGDSVLPNGHVLFAGDAVNFKCSVTDGQGNPVDLDTVEGVDVGLHPNFGPENDFSQIIRQPSIGITYGEVLNRAPSNGARYCKLRYWDENDEEFVSFYSTPEYLTFAGPTLTIENDSPESSPRVEIDEPLEYRCRMEDPWGNPISGQLVDIGMLRTIEWPNAPWTWSTSSGNSTTDASGVVRFNADPSPEEVSDQIDPSSFDGAGISESLTCSIEYARGYAVPEYYSSSRSSFTWIPADSIKIDLTHSIPPVVELTETVNWSCYVQDEAGNPMSGNTVQSSFAGGAVFNATTDQNGVANFSWGPSSPVPIAPGFHRPHCRMVDPIWSSFFWNVSHQVAGFTVEPSFNRILTATPLTQTSAIGDDVSWTCKIEDENGNPLEGKTIFGNFTISAVSDVNGLVQFTVPSNASISGRWAGGITELSCWHVDPVAAPGIVWRSESVEILWAANPGTVVFDLKVFLDGPYTDGEMSTVLSDEFLISHYQPYSQSPWFFETEEPLGQARPEGAVDWIMVSLRTSLLASSEIGRKALFLKPDGSINDRGKLNITFDGVNNGSYYVVIEHRNHLPIMSANPVSINSSPDCLERYCYDFSQEATYGTGAQRDLGNGVYGMWGGDGNLDGQVTAFDFLNVWLPGNGGGAGYDFGDFDMNGTITAFDFLKVWLPANGRSVQF